MKLLQLPHKTADYLCPINGLADIYEWKTGERIPDPLLFYARSGFLLISDKRVVPPRMILFSTCSIGRKQYEFWGKFMGYELHQGEGKTFRNSLANIHALIDRGIPVILFGLDMFHLEYQEKFYHRIHVPGHVLLMVGYDTDCIYVHDNSKQEIQRVFLTDLEPAWGQPYLNISRKNAYFGIEFMETCRDSGGILKRAYAHMAGLFLNAPVNFMGARGMKKLISELPAWHCLFNDKAIEEIYRFFIMFTGSVLPKLPKELDESDLSMIYNPNRGTRDLFSGALQKFGEEYENESWLTAAGFFAESGELIEKIAERFAQSIKTKTWSGQSDLISLFKKLLESESKAFSELR